MSIAPAFASKDSRAIGRTTLAIAGGHNAGWLSAGNDLHEIQIAGRVFLKLLHHAFEHVEGLPLVFDQRILLTIPTQTNSLFEVVHVKQVIFPKLVEHA